MSADLDEVGAAFSRGAFRDVVLYSNRPFDEHGAILPGGHVVGVMFNHLHDDWFAFYRLRDGASGSTSPCTRDEAARAAAERAVWLLDRGGR